MTFLGSLGMGAGAALIAVGALNNLNVAQIPPGMATTAGIFCIGAGAAFELL